LKAELDMAHKNEDIADWIREIWAADYFRFDDIQADFKVISFKRVDDSLFVKISFVGDESKKGVDSESLVLFRYDPENHRGFFPGCVQIITVEEKYTWENSEKCDSLAEHISEDTLDVDVDYVDWDDPILSNDAVEQLVNSYDQYAIADTLVNKFGARNNLPDFIPERLKPHFKKIIDDFEQI
jgi:hypothetical protein